MGPIFAKVFAELSLENGVVTIVTSFNSSRSLTDGCKIRIHLRSLNVRILEWLKVAYWIKKYGVENTFNGMVSLLNFIKIY